MTQSTLERLHARARECAIQYFNGLLTLPEFTDAIGMIDQYVDDFDGLIDPATGRRM